MGSAIPAAGGAGLIKAALAVYHRVLPPSLHCEEPHPTLATTRFRVLQTAEPWERNGHPRRAGVSACGVGGVNAHVVLEAHDGVDGRHRRIVQHATTAELPDSERFLVLARDTPEALLRALDEGSDEI